jgi:hypothetical protein
MIILYKNHEWSVLEDLLRNMLPLKLTLCMRRCLCRLVVIGHGVQEVPVAALVDQRAEPTVLFLEELARLVKLDLAQRNGKSVIVSRGPGHFFFCFQRQDTALTIRPASKTI